MPETRQIPAEGLVEEDVLGRGRDPLLGADDVADLHQMVIDDVGQMIRGEAVRFEQHLVVHVVVREGDGAAQLVAEGGLALYRNLEADDRRATLRLKSSNLRRGQLAVRPVVARRQLGGNLRLAHGVQLFGGLEAAVGVSGLEQQIDMLAVDLGAFGLAIRAKWATNVGTLVPSQAEPAQRIEDHLLRVCDEASAVGVFDA